MKVPRGGKDRANSNTNIHSEGQLPYHSRINLTPSLVLVQKQLLTRSSITNRYHPMRCKQQLQPLQPLQFHLEYRR